ncbi:hypothetical protein CLV81_3250 [Flagellimonas meridianipacifica]|uniref:Uncharacterized protein n=1 Tax=Flagellimonas meridianipacifica TaxID=1080225 RepID=A0A2T0MBH1_9FLAO|nr:hypothetical protein CLV81_3250 [Allomuricauda pacifica]
MKKFVLITLLYLTVSVIVMIAGLAMVSEVL